MTRKHSLIAAGLAVALVGLVTARVFSEPADTTQARQTAYEEFRKGNWRDALDRFKTILADPKADGEKAAQDLNTAVQCLGRLGRINELDALIESAVKAHPKDWRLLQAAAQNYLNTTHYGYMIAGEYRRGPHRGGGKMANSLERDRVRAIQLLEQALPLVREDDNKREVSAFYQQFANALLYNRGYSQSWRLQYLTKLKELPDYDTGYPYYRSSSAAPVDEEGNPVFHHLPKDWKTAKTDGERWRWLLMQAIENDPSQRFNIMNQQASFYLNQFGVQTMRSYGRHFARGPVVDDGDKDESGTYALHTLKENESIAKLATGVKRFEIPDEFNFIKIWQQIAAEAKGSQAESALQQLAQIFENRRQYPKAAEYWKQNIEEHGPGHNNYKKKRLDQIVGNWGHFEAIMTQPAGQGATVEYRFRNAKKLRLTAHAIKVDKLLADTKEYLKSDPGRRIDYHKVNLGNIGYRLVHQNQAQYVGEQVAQWELDLKPRDNHWDSRITITTPLQKPGAYLVTANLQDGNTAKIVMWVADTSIVKKTLSGKNLYFVADAVTGKPIDGANLEFFGYRYEHIGGGRRRVVTTNFAEQTDRDGLAMPDQRDLQNNFQWLVIARTGQGRLAYYGFHNVWTARHHDADYNAVKIFTITDRPVYRPDHTVKFKMWVRHAQYDKENESQFAGQKFPVVISNPKGEKIYTESLETDEFGGMAGELKLPSDATLGMYHIRVQRRDNNRRWISGGSSFRVEEYKKPEFEVTVEAPDEPVMLGEKIQGKIKAKYYFGSPVVNATVKYKIMREDYSQNWYPVGEWDWFYGRGYWWFCYDYPWYPGWNEWVGCVRPIPWWWHGRSHNPPELVAEQEVEIAPDGTVTFEIDTAIAKELHGNKDHKYSVTAEVRDESRRTIVGTGEVLVARKPFKVFSWVNRGYYRVGHVVKANFLAQTLDSKPVKGKGVLTLYKITYKDNKPVETPVARWDLDTNDEGRAEIQGRASAKGQYRLSYQVTDSKNHTIEGGYIYTVIGEGFDGADYRFNNIELIPDKKQYQPGETVKLQINTDRVGSTVLLFTRPSNGVYLPPQVIRLEGKSTVAEIPVTKKDMPNFFVEAVTISGAKVYTEVKEIIVPPEKRVLTVKVTPSSKEYKPGEKATVKVQLFDHTGEPFQGSTVVTIYDKSVEYISGGSNVPDIREFYWKWRRRHNERTESSLARYFGNIYLPGATGMSYIGAFGASLVDDLDAMDDANEIARIGEGKGQGFGGGGVERRQMAMRKGAVAESAVAADAAGAPAPSATPAPGGLATRRALGPAGDDKAKRDGGGTQQLVEPTVRTKFADTALWVAKLETDKTGTAEVALDMPENLTGWKVKVWGMGHGTKVGVGEEEVVTRQNLILRLQAPRFFVEKDEVVLTANVHNYLKSDKTATVSLEIPGEELKSLVALEQKVTIPAGGEKRVDWRVKVTREGTATVRMKALTDEESDAMEMKFPVYVHGMLKTESWAGTVRPEQEKAQVTINVPKERRINESDLTIRFSPTLAGAMVDALPYLADYPYGCTEQTLNRFLPTVITQKVLLDMNLNLAEIRDKRTNLNAQELGDPQKRAAQWKRFDRNPVWDEAEVRRMVKEGLKALTNMQNADGGWGWFSGRGERSWPHTTAVVVHGLQIAKQNDVALVPGMLERGIAWLKRYQEQEAAKIADPNHPKTKAGNLDAMVFMILTDAGVKHDEMLGYLYRDRKDLAVYAKAMYGLALVTLKEDEKLAMIMKNIDQYLVQDAENETAYLKLPANNYWWYWYGSETEANAYYLKLLARTEPKGQRAPRLVKYLLNNRKHATYWRSTRDTAVCVEAFADYIKATGEMKPDMFVEIWIDGKKRHEVKIDETNLFTVDNTYKLVGDAVPTGSHVVEIRRRGKGPVYFNAYLTNFTLEDFITKAGLEVKVERNYFRLEPVKATTKVVGDRGQALDQRVEKYKRIPLKNDDELVSGDLVEIELVIESKNDYEYLIFEDMKAAGFEAVEVRSGYTANGLGAYTEYRDNRVSFFVRRLARGKHSISYRMRAEIPGKFSALPARA